MEKEPEPELEDLEVARGCSPRPRQLTVNLASGTKHMDIYECTTFGTIFQEFLGMRGMRGVQAADLFASAEIHSKKRIYDRICAHGHTNCFFEQVKNQTELHHGLTNLVWKHL